MLFEEVDEGMIRTLFLVALESGARQRELLALRGPMSTSLARSFT